MTVQPRRSAGSPALDESPRARRDARGSRTVGALRYLNALPLIDGLEEDPEVAEVRYEIPSLLARDLRQGELSLALVPHVEAFKDPRYRVVPEIAIGCRGPVESILLFTTREWNDIHRIGVDLSSNTSVELLKVLFHHRTGRIPECVAIPPRLDALRRSPTANSTAEHGPLDAILLIGDRALAEDHGEFPRFDLGALWFDSFALPFVFAVWLGREDTPSELVAAVERCKLRGLERRGELAREFVREYPEVADSDTALRYITQIIRYDLGAPEKESLLTFQRLREQAGLLHPGATPPLQFFER